MKALLIISFICISLFAFAQEDKIPKNGKVTLYYPAEDGIRVVKAIGMNKKNKPVGTWQFYAPNGIPDYTIEYKGVSTIRKTKLWTTVISEEHFTNDTLDGIQMYYTLHEEKTVQVYYTKGRLDSVLQFYEYAKNYATIAARYVFYPDLKLKQIEEFFPTGERKSIKSYDKRGQLDGLSEKYDVYKHSIYLIRREEYKNGRLNGVVIVGSKNGILSECTYENGLRHGIYTEYSLGAAKFQYDVEYVYGVKTGKGIRYYSNGNVFEEEYWSGVAGKYSKDVYDSCITYWDNGNVQSKEYNTQLNDYQLENREIKFYPSGKIDKEFARVNGKYNGVYKMYNEDGILHREVPYKLGVIDGKMLFWHTNGKKRIELIVKNDTVISQKVWDKQGKIVSSKSAGYKDLIKPATWYDQLVNLDIDYETLMEKYREIPMVVALDTDVHQAVKETDRNSKKSKFDKNAEFPGGWVKLNEFIDSVKRKPEILKTLNTSVSVNIEYKVQSDGTVSLIKIEPLLAVSGYAFFPPLLEMEVRRIFSLISFRPAVLNGKNVTSWAQGIVISL